MAVTQGGRSVVSGRGGGDVASGSTGTNIGQREDLSNFISMITRDETPFMSSIGKTKATAIFHEWQTDTLESPGDSTLTEGFDYVSPPAIAVDSEKGTKVALVGPNRTRLGNYCQINGKTIAVSGTRRAIDSAGVADEYAYQLKKRGTEMRRDIERDLVNTTNTSGVRDGTDRRQMGTLRAWISPGAATVEENNVSPLSAANQGIGTEVASNHGSATKVSLSLSDVDAVMQSIYEEGGKATKIMVSPKLRRDFSDLMVTDSGVRRNLDEKGKLRQSVDVYMSDFGDLMVMPNYVMGLTNGGLENEAAFIYDPQWFAMATLRPMQEVEVGQKGDSTVGMFVEEQTFEVKNPLGSGAIYGLS